VVLDHHFQVQAIEGWAGRDFQLLHVACTHLKVINATADSAANISEDGCCFGSVVEVKTMSHVSRDGLTRFWAILFVFRVKPLREGVGELAADLASFQRLGGGLKSTAT
jgi:hypothetical protein